MRRLARVDANHAGIVQLLRSAGARVQSLAQVGGGVPDLLVGYQGKIALVEVKDGAKAPSYRVLTPAEQAWHSHWEGYPVYVVESDADALKMLEALR